MARLVDVGHVDDFPIDRIKIVTVDNVEIGVLRWHDGTVFAVRNVCPHMKGPVCRGSVSPLLTADRTQPGVLAVDRETPVLSCAWHGWEFNVRTGIPIVLPARYRLRTYVAHVEEARVLVDVGGGVSIAADVPETAAP